MTRVTRFDLFSYVLSGMNLGESEEQVTSVTPRRITSPLLDPSRSPSISSRHLSDRSRPQLRWEGTVGLTIPTSLLQRAHEVVQ